MSSRRQVVIALLRIVLSSGILLLEFFFVSWAGSRTRDDCYVGHTHRSLQDNIELTVHSMFTVPNVFGA